MDHKLIGIGVSKGIAIGSAYLMHRSMLEVLEYVLPKPLLDDEVARLNRALETARQELKDIRERIPPHTPVDIAEFINTHLLMMEDATLTEGAIALIRSLQCNAEWALKLQRDALVNVFEEMDDPYLRTRKDDVDHVIARVQRILLGQATNPTEKTDRRHGQRILIADDLAPPEVVLFHNQGIAAFVTEHGAPLSHTAILARSLGIPTVVGVHGAHRLLNDGQPLIVDGEQGIVLAEPDTAEVHFYESRRRHQRENKIELNKLRHQPTITLDGQAIRLMANIELPEDLAAVNEVASEGVGLYRTEFIYMNRDDMPDEEEHVETYSRVVKALRGAPVTIRTLDLGADKQIDSDGGIDPGRNPAMGLRGIRLCLEKPRLFIPQLRAILRVSVHGPVRMMIPMLSCAEELFQVKTLLSEVKRDLTRRNIAFDHAMPIGGVIEVPAAALCAYIFVRQMDFLSIGTNDLIQYTLAIDRVADEVNYLYDPLHPAVLQLIYTVIQASRRKHTPVAMCGEMAGDPRYTRVLLGLGLTEFSMRPSSLLEVKQVINSSDISQLSSLTGKLLASASLEETTLLLQEINEGLD